jgi:hypothetical protein
MSGFEYYEADSYAVVDQSEEKDDFDLFLALWNRERDCFITTRSTQS